MPDLFPNAPSDWDVSFAESIASEEGIELSDDHWQLVRALQEYYSKSERPHLRQITDALEESFHSKGGIKYLHQIIPEGPIAKGVDLQGLKYLSAVLIPPLAVQHKGVGASFHDTRQI